MSALLGCGIVVLAGCGSMPVTGDVKAVDASQPGDSQVQVYAVAPREGAPPSEIVDGFLESMTSDDPAFATTRKYLSADARRTWQPSGGTTVLAQAPNRSGPLLHDEDNRATRDRETTYTLTGEKVAAVDAQSSYQPLAPTDYSQTLHLVLEKVAEGKQEWRIDVVPDGLVLGQSDFKRLYRSVNKYYFATGRTNGRSTLVADPVYVRNRTDPVTRMDTVTQTVRTLLAGPTNWLRPVVDSRFPTGTALRKGVTALAPDDQNVLKVPLNQKADKASRSACRMMAAQVLFTLRDLTSARVERVELEGGEGKLCALDADDAPGFSADHGSDGADSQYFINDKGQVERIPGATDGTGTPEPVTGPLGVGAVPMGAVGVARDEKRAAAVSANGQNLYVSSLEADGELAEPLVTSAAKKAADRLSPPSWDGRGDLWVADRDPAGSRLLRLAGGAGEPQEVRVPGLDGARIEELRMSADGVRIALLLTKDGHTTLNIGRVERRGSSVTPEISVEDLRQAAPQLADVTAISWSGRSRLVVVGKEEGGVQQVRYVQADGSTSASGALPGVNQVQSVAAADDELLPLMAETVGDGIVKLSPGDNWQTVLKQGTSLVYPG
ncbi:LpqB family beta-propeller domain-containing protein [Streptomyces fimicarius]|uniref:LpqB family beta-propeller domain-containing protein n=1 Tax=Streptomyces caviscabies TaxID=90079 RepID=A0ABW2M686_9ACTN|nr:MULTISPECIES: LpqB family beta-propeller domain-containing protein [Streptomyces]MDX3502842.1 LpqB family beta-propeller domain-containing protein [Streptomyces sp. ATCC51928]MDX3595881.1 LpqB family beta-propeller domain-containing protein [Streptomyces sp. ID03-2B]MDX5523118.1 LpqB family beta-propeller domain-containing protein [Streptomyces sp. DE06-01C]